MMETKLIGLVGGLGPDATWFYYRALLAAARRRGLSPRLLVNHADLQTVIEAADRGDRATLIEHLGARLSELERAGAALTAISAVTPHMVAPELVGDSRVPFIDIVTVIDRALQRRALRRVALLGSRSTVQSRLFGRLNATIIDPAPDQIDRIHALYVAIAGGGDAEAAAELAALARDLSKRLDLDAIILAGTDLSPLPPDLWAGSTIIDSAGLHAEAIVDAASAR